MQEGAYRSAEKRRTEAVGGHEDHADAHKLPGAKPCGNPNRKWEPRDASCKRANASVARNREPPNEGTAQSPRTASRIKKRGPGPRRMIL